MEKMRKTAEKNYLTRDELEALGRIVNAYLDLAESRARRKIPMTMEDWAKSVDFCFWSSMNGKSCRTGAG